MKGNPTLLNKDMRSDCETDRGGWDVAGQAEGRNHTRDQ